MSLPRAGRAGETEYASTKFLEALSSSRYEQYTPGRKKTCVSHGNGITSIYHWTEVRLYPACKSFQAEVPYPLPDHPSVQRSEQGLRVHLAPGRTLVVQSGGIQRVYPHSAEFIRSSTTEPLVADGTTKANPNRPSCTHSAVAIIERKLRLRRS